MRIENARRQPRRDSTGINNETSDGDFAYTLETTIADDSASTACAGPPCASADQAVELSSRAQNVLKELATELIGETPPRGRWVPSDLLLQRLTYRHLATARNCGPQTTAEIARWAKTKGKIIEPPSRVGKSLSAIWQDAMKKFSSGTLSNVEVAEVLENSTRRRNTRVPVEFQKMLVQFVNPSGK